MYHTDNARRPHVQFWHLEASIRLCPAHTARVLATQDYGFDACHSAVRSAQSARAFMSVQ